MSGEKSPDVINRFALSPAMADETLKSEDIEKVKHILIEWDNLVNPKAPLSERQLLAIDRIAEAVKQQPLPKEVRSRNLTLFLT